MSLYKPNRKIANGCILIGLLLMVFSACSPDISSTKVVNAPKPQITPSEKRFRDRVETLKRHCLFGVTNNREFHSSVSASFVKNTVGTLKISGGYKTELIAIVSNFFEQLSSSDLKVIVLGILKCQENGLNEFREDEKNISKKLKEKKISSCISNKLSSIERRKRNIRDDYAICRGDHEFCVDPDFNIPDIRKISDRLYRVRYNETFRYDFQHKTDIDCEIKVIVGFKNYISGAFREVKSRTHRFYLEYGQNYIAKGRISIRKPTKQSNDWSIDVNYVGKCDPIELEEKLNSISINKEVIKQNCLRRHF